MRNSTPHTTETPRQVTPFCASGSPDCDADYDLNSRPQEVRDAISRVSLTGRIGKPLLQLQGTLDTAVTPRDSRHYTK